MIPINIVVVGDSLSGKTALISSFTQTPFPEEHTPTTFDNVNLSLPSGALLTIVDTCEMRQDADLTRLSFASAAVVFVILLVRVAAFFK